MFTTFSLLKSKPVCADEKQQFWRLIESYASTESGKWLNDFQWKAFDICWCPAMTISSGVMGAFVPWFGEKVFLMQADAPAMPGARDPWPSLIASTLVHELRHLWQFKRHPLLYVLCCLPVLRGFTLERDAWAQTKPAQDFFDALERLRSASEFAAATLEQREVADPAPLNQD